MSWTRKSLCSTLFQWSLFLESSQWSLSEILDRCPMECAHNSPTRWPTARQEQETAVPCGMLTHGLWAGPARHNFMHGCRAIGLVRARRGAARALFDVLVGKHVQPARRRRQRRWARRIQSARRRRTWRRLQPPRRRRRRARRRRRQFTSGAARLKPGWKWK